MDLSYFANHSLSLFQKVLLVTDGTVTELIALYTGEKIQIRKLSQEFSTGNAPLALQASPTTPLVKRTVLLCGEVNSYLFAESWLRLDRLSVTAQRQLNETDAPIGLIWKREKLESYREVIEYEAAMVPRVAAYFQASPTALMFSRTYLILHGGCPLGVITETFPATHFR